ncbi:predicted protein [Streptomyces viridosporus ATCC 14672]|uniref:Predicted protein n=1 Tax=Streptomyces viridosporus (strain ATCC 14672 / DSM 40746 / JCM 4963 / KCTC 9882 / NRRL B-12104 / FH 1290) TaxID=566461 RepID=D5ZV49_STRV1|nr:predicted protein [Streptomyces viridosporus ATCC 14672]
MEQDQGATEALLRGGGAGPGQPPAARRAQSSVALPGGQGADVVAEPDGVQPAQRVGRQGDGRADRLQGGGPFQHRHPRTAPVQGDRRGQAADPPADHDRPFGSPHGSSSPWNYICSKRTAPTVLQP